MTPERQELHRQVFGLAMFIPLLDMICLGESGDRVCTGLLGVIPGSHQDTSSGGYDRPHRNISAKKGSVVIYDTRLYHRGLENNSSALRPIIQINYAKKQAVDDDLLQLKGNYGSASLYDFPVGHPEL
mmetsp:Transcript_95346/g.218399  ORF Transcript_95346/g.218399 Transcript_95346/m.218399 type:complete len:128 (+) Transcript_95346:509-892(+)